MTRTLKLALFFAFVLTAAMGTGCSESPTEPSSPTVRASIESFRLWRGDPTCTGCIGEVGEIFPESGGYKVRLIEMHTWELLLVTPMKGRKIQGLISSSIPNFREINVNSPTSNGKVKYGGNVWIRLSGAYSITINLEEVGSGLSEPTVLQRAITIVAE